jgi:hypothetical protein
MNFSHKTKWISPVKIEILIVNTEVFHKYRALSKKGCLCFVCAFNAQYMHKICTVHADKDTVNAQYMHSI